jgi:hypothetical protein
MERRAFPRFATNLSTSCRLVTDHATMPARIRNVSRVGINLVVDRPFEPGEMLQVDLPYNGQHPETVVLACIMHCSAFENQFSLGCMFSEELGDEELAEFGGQRERTSENDQRTWRRFPSQGKVYFSRLPSDGLPPRVGDLVNISPAGIGLQVEDRLEPGAVLSLELHREGKDLFTILACAVYLSERREGGWLIGCNFIRELEESELMELV